MVEMLPVLLFSFSYFPNSITLSPRAAPINKALLYKFLRLIYMDFLKCGLFLKLLFLINSFHGYFIFL